MSPNPNYRAGRAFEYKRKAHYQKEGYEMIRASGSHGLFDLVGFHPDKPTIGVQCKRVQTHAEGLRLLKNFKETPPLRPSKYFHQLMDVYVKKTQEILSVFV